MAGTKLKVLLVGDCDVGKTSLMFRFVRNQFDPNAVRSTIICDFLRRKVEVNGEEYSLVLWDMSGSERFTSSLTPVFCRAACACLLIFAIDNMESFRNLAKWRASFLENSPDLSDKENFPFVVVGNKSDLTTERQVTHEMVESWCKELGDLHYVETSAKDGSGVYEAFLMAAKKYSELGPEEKSCLIGHKHCELVGERKITLQSSGHNCCY